MAKLSLTAEMREPERLEWSYREVSGTTRCTSLAYICILVVCFSYHFTRRRRNQGRLAGELTMVVPLVLKGSA